jgi:pimeloyl-ACP methyl ester carboxylesterase
MESSSWCFLLATLLLPLASCIAEEGGKIAVENGKIAELSKVNLWYESFGEVEDPCILLIMGATTQGICWPDELCTTLAKNGFRVIRYDHRDTGLSTSFDFQENPYALDDLAQDALDLLQHLNINKAHFVGASMGGFITQILASNYPEYFLSATIMSSTPNNSVIMDAFAGKDVSDASLPPPTAEVLKFASKGPPEDPNDRESAIAYYLAMMKLHTGGEREVSLDEERQWLDMFTKCSERIHNKDTSFNHILAISASPGDRTESLKHIKTRTLVLHGSNDFLIPPEHAEALAQLIPNSTLQIIPDMGHIGDSRFGDLTMKLILEHLFNNKA